MSTFCAPVDTKIAEQLGNLRKLFNGEKIIDIDGKQQFVGNKIKDTYTSSLLKKSIARISQKVGEEAVEVVIAANLKDKKQTITESADLLFHLMVLWKKLGIKEEDIANIK